MSISRISIVLILVLVSTAASRSMAQHSRLEPRQPRWGQTVTVTYDPASAQAKLRQSNDLYLVVEMIFPLENSFRSFRMKREGSRYEASFEIPSGLSALRLHFLSLTETGIRAHSSRPPCCARTENPRAAPLRAKS